MQFSFLSRKELCCVQFLSGVIYFHPSSVNHNPILVAPVLIEWFKVDATALVLQQFVIVY